MARRYKLPKPRPRAPRFPLPTSAKDLPKDWVPLGEGCTRKVYSAHPGYVVKVEHCWGDKCNAQEYAAYRDYVRGKSRIPVAPCWLRGPFLIMEEVQVLHTPRDPYGKFREPIAQIPKWVKQLDSEQIGRDRRGRLVAFDMGGYYIPKKFRRNHTRKPNHEEAEET